MPLVLGVGARVLHGELLEGLLPLFHWSEGIGVRPGWHIIWGRKVDLVAIPLLQCFENLQRILVILLRHFAVGPSISQVCRVNLRLHVHRGLRSLQLPGRFQGPVHLWEALGFEEVGVAFQVVGEAPESCGMAPGVFLLQPIARLLPHRIQEQSGEVEGLGLQVWAEIAVGDDCRSLPRLRKLHADDLEGGTKVQEDHIRKPTTHEPTAFHGDVYLLLPESQLHLAVPLLGYGHVAIFVQLAAAVAVGPLKGHPFLLFGDGQGPRFGRSHLDILVVPGKLDDGGSPAAGGKLRTSMWFSPAVLRAPPCTPADCPCRLPDCCPR